MIDRRGFIKVGGVAALGAAAGVSLLSRRAQGAAWMLPDTTPESPTTYQLQTIAMICDAVIPNTDGPGALESRAVDTIVDPFYGLNPYISEVVSDIDAATWGDYKDQNLATRTDNLEERLGWKWYSPGSVYKDAYDGIILLTKLNFFGGLVNTVGYGYIGFPGQSGGYSETGNKLPDPESCAGNCGGSGGACWCDTSCTTYGDCCSDQEQLCI
jgi:hypothetical protein